MNILDIDTTRPAKAKLILGEEREGYQPGVELNAVQFHMFEDAQLPVHVWLDGEMQDNETTLSKALNEHLSNADFMSAMASQVFNGGASGSEETAGVLIVPAKIRIIIEGVDRESHDGSSRKSDLPGKKLH